MFKVQGADQSSRQQLQQQHGWNRSSYDYNNHLTQMMRTTTILPDAPPYPSVHSVFKKQAAAVTTALEQLSPTKATAKKHVRIAEPEKIGSVEEKRVDGEIFDSDADSVQQKQKGFELCKWTTFKKAR